MKKLLVILAFAVFFLGCGQELVEIKGEDGKSCTLEGSFLVCEDGTAFDTTGVPGLDGTSGLNGTNGVDGIDGADGQDGANGQDGLDGKDGLSCTVTQTDGGALVDCEDGTTAIINHGDSCVAVRFANITQSGVAITCGENDPVYLFDGAEGPRGPQGLPGPKGPKGDAGQDGQDGADGEDGVILTTSTLTGPNGNCGPIFPGLWGQLLDGGYVMDVYTNSTCNDYTGAEVCDNVAVSYGANNNPPVGWEHPGGAKVCWHENLMISGKLLDSGDIKVYILEFNL